MRWPSFQTLLPLAVIAAALLLLPPLGARAPWQETFAATFISLVLTALPWLAIGALAGAAVELWMPAQLLPRLAGRLGIWGIPAAALASVALPVCECGVIGVARGLVRRGLPLPHAIAYILAGPVLNPTVLLTTGLAFGSLEMVLLRAGGALFVATVAGLIVRRWGRDWLLPGLAPAPLLRLGGARRERIAQTVAPGAAVLAPTAPAAAPRRRLAAFCEHGVGHFLAMAGPYVLGACLAAGMAAGVAQARLDVAALAGGPLLGPPLGMASAFALSLCSEVDAFVAASFRSQGAGLPAILAFLVFGPMCDIKLMMVQGILLRGRAVLAIAGIVAALAWIYAVVAGTLA